MNVANTILAQLGGNKFAAMTGAKNFIGGESMLQFSLPRLALHGINKVRIELTPADTYTVTFYKQGRSPRFELATIRELEGVTADALRTAFTATTGLDVSL